MLSVWPKQKFAKDEESEVFESICARALFLFRNRSQKMKVDVIVAKDAKFRSVGANFVRCKGDW
jgi:hypothetical protein